MLKIYFLCNLVKVGDYKLLIQSGLLEKTTYFVFLLCCYVPQIKLGSEIIFLIIFGIGKPNNEIPCFIKYECLNYET
jgi:hypothetical protein